MRSRYLSEEEQQKGITLLESLMVEKKDESEEESKKDEKDMEECGGPVSIMDRLDDIEKEKYQDEDEGEDEGEDEYEGGEDEGEDEEEGATIVINLDDEIQLDEGKFGDFLQKATRGLVGGVASAAKGIGKGAVEGIVGKTLAQYKNDKLFRKAADSMHEFLTNNGLNVSEKSVDLFITKLLAKKLLDSQGKKKEKTISKGELSDLAKAAKEKAKEPIVNGDEE